MSVRMVCKNCGKGIATILKLCPHCGFQHPLTKAGKQLQKEEGEKMKCPKCGEKEAIYGNKDGVFCERCGYKILSRLRNP